MKNTSKLAIIDIETSGPSPSRDRVLEVGLVLVDDWSKVEVWSSLVNPGRSVSPIITSITGIRTEDVMYAPRFSHIAETLLDLTKDRVLVAHNARFDYGFLQYEFKRNNYKWQVPHVCSVKLSRQLYPGYRKHGLDKLIERFGIDCNQRHRALGDASAVWEFMKLSLQNKGENEFFSVFEKILKKPSLPMLIESELVEKLPNSPGVYVFYDEYGQVLYVGKSVKVKERVRSHFYSDLIDKKELKLKERVANIEVIEASGELEALLLEADMVKLLQPEFNRQLKSVKTLYVLRLSKDKSGYMVVNIDEVAEIKTAKVEKVFGVFRSKKQAISVLGKIALEFGLCDRLLGLEKTDKECFGFHLNRCKGACVGKVSAMDYNRDLLRSLNRYAVRSWPFEGPVGIWQENESLTQKGLLVFDKWVYLGRYRDCDEATEELKDVGELDFDYDKYRILRRFLAESGKENFQVLNQQAL